MSDGKEALKCRCFRDSGVGVVVGTKLLVTRGDSESGREARMGLTSLAGSEPFVNLPEPMAHHCLKMVNETTAFFYEMSTKVWSEKFDVHAVRNYFITYINFEFLKHLFSNVL